MKLLLLLPTFLLFSIGILPPQAPLQWEQAMTHDFGDIRQGKETTVIFSFRNEGTDSLYIDNVRTACGCTSPEWEDVRVAPGELGHVSILYDAEDTGYFNKWIKVYFNGYRRAEKLWIEGYVE